MPEIQITMRDRGTEVRRQLVKELTQVMVNATGVHPEDVVIHFYDTDLERAGRGGLLYLDRLEGNK
jgi:phenylpyruvate tautomerase PptA (4-oxalocrotonate tautomerase family)